MADNTLFDQIENLWSKTTPVKTNTKPESIYMANRFLSLTPEGFMTALDCNETIGCPDWAALPFLYYALPQIRRPQGKYPKKPPAKLSDKRKRALSRVCTKFNVKDFHGLQIMVLLEQNGVKLESD